MRAAWGQQQKLMHFNGLMRQRRASSVHFSKLCKRFLHAGCGWPSLAGFSQERRDRANRDDARQGVKFSDTSGHVITAIIAQYTPLASVQMKKEISKEGDSSEANGPGRTDAAKRSDCLRLGGVPAAWTANRT